MDRGFREVPYSHNSLFYYLVASIVGVSYWVVQVFGYASTSDIFRIISTLLVAIYITLGRDKLVAYSIVIGLLSGSLQGLLIDSVQYHSSSLFSNTLMVLLLACVISACYGKFYYHKTLRLSLMLFIPVLFGMFMFVFGDYHFIQSEAKKYLIFSIFLIASFSLGWEKLPILLEISVHSIMFVSLCGVLVYCITGTGYNYGNESFALIPVSIMLVPMLFLFRPNLLLQKYCMVILLLLIFGVMQPSSKLILLLMMLFVAALKRSSIVAFAFLALVATIVINGLLVFDDILRHKVFSVIAILKAGIGVFWSQSDIDPSLVFVTSAGNIFAEFVTIIKLLSDSWFLPIGAGFAITDPFGWLSLANEYAYDATSSELKIFPLHLGLFYLLVWFGPFIFLLGKSKQTLYFLSAFCLLGLSAPSAILLSGILSPMLKKDMKHAN